MPEGSSIPRDQNRTIISRERPVLIVTPATASLQIGQTQQLSVSGATTQVRWSSSRPAIASVSKTGLVTALAVGIAAVTARSGSARATSTITVGGTPPVPPTVPPTVAKLAVSAPGNTIAGSTWSFSTAGTTDPTGTLLTWALDYGDGTTPPNGPGAPPLDASLDHVYASVGTYTAVLTVVGSAGGTGTASVQVLVTADPPPVPQSPVANLTYVSGQFVGQPYVFSTEGTYDPDGTIASWTYNPNDGSPVQGDSGVPPATLSFTPAAAGTFVPEFTVTDNDGLVGAVTRSILIQAAPTPPPHQPPVAALSLVSGSRVGDTFQFSTAGTTDFEGTIVAYGLSYGDGVGENAATPPPASPLHVYTAAGSYTATLVVTNNFGLTASVSIPVPVQAVPVPPSGDTPLTRNEHPRLGMTLADRAAVKARISSGGEWFTDFQAYVDYLTHTSVWDSGSTGQITMSDRAAAAGFVYQMFEGGAPAGIVFPAHANTQAEWAAKGVDWLLRVGAQAGIVGEYTRSMFYGYDWLHNALSAEQRSGLISAWKTNLAGFGGWVGSEAAYPSWDAFFYSNSEYSAFYGYWVLAGLAALGDGVETAWLQAGIDRYNWAFHATDPNNRAQVTRESQRGGVDGANMQGWYYGQVLMARIGLMEMGYRTANGRSAAVHYADNGQTGWIKSWVPYIVRAMRPWHWNEAGQSRQILAEPGVASDATTGNLSFRLAAAFARHEFPGVDQDLADLAIWFLENRGNLDTDPDAFWYTKFLSAKGTGKSPTTLAMSGDKAYSAGKWQWRTGWDSINDVLVQVIAWRFGALAGAGQITIDYGGVTLPLGPYRNHDLDSGHVGYSRNLLGFVDTTRSTFETTSGFLDDWGFTRAADDPPNLLRLVAGTIPDFSTAPVLYRATIADGIGYLSLNLVRQYNSSTVNSPTEIEQKISAYTRQLIYFPPATPGTSPLRLFVFDFATTLDTKFQKRQTWVSFAEPNIDGSAAPGPSRPPVGGTTARKTTYTGATRIRMDQSAANSGATRLYVTPIAPAFSVVKVAFRYTDGEALLETSYGMPYLPGSGGAWSGDAVGDFDHYGAWWRVEVIPTVSQVTDQMVTVLEAFPNTSGAQSTTEAVGGTSFVGARAGDAIGVHRTSVGSTGAFVVPSTGSYTVLVAGLTASTSRTFTPGANITVNSQGSTSAEGTVKLTITVSGAGSGAANTITVS